MQVGNVTEGYMVVQGGEDGPRIAIVSRAQLSAALDNGDYAGVKFMAAAPVEHDTNYWPADAALALKVKVVVPRAIEKITHYEVE